MLNSKHSTIEHDTTAPHSQSVDSQGDEKPKAQAYQGFSVIEMTSNPNGIQDISENIPNLDIAACPDPTSPEATSPLSIPSLFSDIRKTVFKSQTEQNQTNAVTPDVFSEISSPVSIHYQTSANSDSNDQCNADPIFKGPLAENCHAEEYKQMVEENGSDNIRFPVICLVDYGIAGAYASDLWVLFHNTLRRQLFDFFDIMIDIRKIGFAMTSADMRNLRRWWRFFVVLWAEFTAHEKASLDPIVHHICQVDGRSESLLLQIRPLREKQEWLSLKMEEVTSYLEEFESLPPGRALFLFTQTADVFVNKLMVQFSEQEKILPPLVESYFGEHIKQSIESQLVARLRKNRYFGELIISTLRWMGTVEGLTSAESQFDEKEKWICLHLNWIDRVKLSMFKHKFETNHASVVTYFKNRAKNVSV